jgi:hypothetical protein
VILAAAPAFGLSQQIASVDAPAVASSSPVVAAVARASTPADEKPLTGRWLDLKTLSHSERYRNAYADGGVRDFDNAQARSLIEGKIKLDAQGRYDIGFRASSGRYFNWAYSNYTGESFLARVESAQFVAGFYTPAQYSEFTNALFADPVGLATSELTQSNGWEFYMRELYFSATPVKPVTVEFGSFGIDRGLSTEITTFDEDGYLSGERIRLHDSKHLFFDEVSFTNAYFGDVGTVNLFDRGSSLKNFNYRQVIAEKRLNKLFAFSGEYTWQTAIDTTREAVLLNTKISKVVDSVRMEGYERLNSKTFAGAAQSPIGPIPSFTVDGASGLAITAQKTVGKLSGDAGFASVDQDYSVYANSRFFHAVAFPLNGDTFGMGKRAFVHASVKLAPGLSAYGFYTHEVGNERLRTFNQQGLNAGVMFDFKAMANVEKRIF